MSFPRSLPLLLTFIVCIPGCDSATSPADFASDYADHLNQVADALQEVETRDEADAAADEVESLLAEADRLQEQAKNLTDEGDPPQEVQDRLKAATDRVGDEIARLQGSNLITPRLQAALEQLELSSEATINYAKAGSLPAPETPLEEAYVDLFRAEEDLTDIWEGVNDLASAQAAMPAFEEVWKRRDDALIRIAQGGGEYPSFGTHVPEKYKDHFSAAYTRRRQIHEKSIQDEDAVAKLLSERSSTMSDEVSAAFRLSADIRKAGADNMVTVTLRNNRVLQGPRHQKMSQMIKDAAQAQHAEAVIDGDIYQIVLSPVPDMQAFLGRLDLGEVTDVDPQARSFVLTIDPDKVPEAAADTGPGFSPRAGARGGRPGRPQSGRPGARGNAEPVPPGTVTELDKRRIETARARITGQQDSENIIEVHVKNGGAVDRQQMMKIHRAIHEAAGAKRMLASKLQSGDAYLFIVSSKKVQDVADALDLGPVESVDESARKLVLTLDERKVPE
jgi:hypothetical protein